MMIKMTNLKLQVKVSGTRKQFRQIEMGTPLYFIISTNNTCGIVFFERDNVSICVNENDIITLEFGSDYYTMNIEIINKYSKQ